MFETIDDIETTGSTQDEALADTTQQPDTVDTPATPEPDTQPEGEQAGEKEQEPAAEDEPAKKPEPKNGVQKRIGELVKERDIEREQRLQLEQELAKYKQPTSQTTDAEPTLDQFGSIEQWQAAVSKYWQQAGQTEAVQAYQQQQMQLEIQQKAQRFESAEQEFTKTHPDYTQVAQSMAQIVGGQLPEHISQALLDAGDKAPAIAYELGKDMNAFADFLSLPPARQLMRLGAIEDKLGQQKPVDKPVVSKAPAPGKPANNGKTGGEKSIDEMDGDEYLKLMDAKHRK